MPDKNKKEKEKDEELLTPNEKAFGDYLKEVRASMGKKPEKEKEEKEKD